MVLPMSNLSSSGCPLVANGRSWPADYNVRSWASAIDEAKFQEIANAVKRDCPLSQALASVPEITLKAKLR